jgi:hypothetical protein
VGDELHIKALTRLPVASLHDANVETISVDTHSPDGATWTPLAAIGPVEWSFWRIREHAATFYTAAYHDGDTEVDLFQSTDGQRWTRGAPIYTVAADSPLETELLFLPSGELLALVRMDGTDGEVLGDQGRLRTKVCWSSPPFDHFACPQELLGVRLDGPVAFDWNGRVFVVARKHLATGGRKRTALYELPGASSTSTVAIHEWGELPSAGDTAYAGVTPLGGTRFLVSWYSGELKLDEPWLFGILDVTNIWIATLDLANLP